MKKVTALVLAVLLGVGAIAPAASLPTIGPTQTLGLCYAYDLASTSYIYLVMRDLKGVFWSEGEGSQSFGKVTTVAGGSTTLTAVGTDTPFAPMLAGDELTIPLDGVATKLYVVTRTSPTSIVVNTSINLGDGREGASGYGFVWRKFAASTAATAGWIPIRNRDTVTFEVNLTTITATSIDVKLECRLEGAVLGAATVWSKNYTAAGDDMVTISGNRYSSCRVGAKVNTDSGTQSLSITASS